MEDPVTKSKRKGTTVGVEITPDAISLTRLGRLPGGKMMFEAASRFPLDPEVEFGSDEFVTILRQSLREFEIQAKGTEIWTVLGADKARIYHLKIPPMNPAKLGNAVYWALKREEAFEDFDTLMDFEVEDPGGSKSGEPHHVTGILVSKAEVSRCRQLFEKAGHPLTGILLPLHAMRNLLRAGLERESESPALFVHIGMQSSRVSILEQGRVGMTRTIPIGVHTFAETLVQGLVPAPSHIQAVGLVFGLDRSDPGSGRWKAEDIFTALKPALERISRQIERTAEYFQTTFQSARVERMYLAGTISGVGRIVTFLDNQITAVLSVPDPFERSLVETASPPPRESVVSLQALGAALSVPGVTPNLLHTFKDRERARHGKRINQAIFALFLALAVVCGGYYGWQQGQLRELRSERDRLSQSLAGVPETTEALVMATLAEARARDERLRATARRYEGVALLAEINNLTPDHVRLTHFSTRFGPEGASPRRTRLEGIVLGERALLETLLAVHVARLEQSPLLNSIRVEESSLRETGEGPVLQFVMTMDTAKISPEATK